VTEALTLLGAILSFFQNPAGFLMGASHWLSSTLFPPQLQTWFLGTVGAPGATWNTASVYENVYRSMQAPALLVTAAAAAARIVRASFDSRLGFRYIVADPLPRFLIAVAVIGLPGTRVSLGYTAMAWAVDVGITVTALLFGLLLHASLIDGLQPGEGWYDHVSTVLFNAGNDLVAVIIGAIPLLILVLYAAFLMVARTIMLGFCIATAPLCLATAVFDTRNRFVQWWGDLFIGVLLTPVVLAIAIALSITVASSLVPVQLVGPILAFIVMIGGLWFSAKMVHHITWRHFSHGGPIAGFVAGAPQAGHSRVHGRGPGRQSTRAQRGHQHNETTWHGCAGIQPCRCGRVFARARGPGGVRIVDRNAASELWRAQHRWSARRSWAASRGRLRSLVLSARVQRFRERSDATHRHADARSALWVALGT